MAINIRFAYISCLNLVTKLSVNTFISCTACSKRNLPNLIFVFGIKSNHLIFQGVIPTSSAQVLAGQPLFPVPLYLHREVEDWLSSCQPSLRIPRRNKGSISSIASNEELQTLGLLRFGLALLIPTLCLLCRYSGVLQVPFGCCRCNLLLITRHCLKSPACVANYCYIVARFHYNHTCKSLLIRGLILNVVL